MNSTQYLRYRIQDFLDNILYECIDITFDDGDSFITFSKDRINIAIDMITDKPVEVQEDICQGLLLHEVSHLWYTYDNCKQWYENNSVTSFEATWINILEDYRIEAKASRISPTFSNLLKTVNRIFRTREKSMGEKANDYVWDRLFKESYNQDDYETFRDKPRAEEVLNRYLSSEIYVDDQPLETQLELARILKPEQQEQEEQVEKAIKTTLQQMLGNIQSSEDAEPQNSSQSSSQSTSDEDGSEESGQQGSVDDVAEILADILKDQIAEPPENGEFIANEGVEKRPRTDTTIKNQNVLSFGYWNWDKGYSEKRAKKSERISQELRKNVTNTTASRQRNFTGRFDLRASIQPNNYRWFTNQEQSISLKNVLFVFDTSCKTHYMSAAYMKWFYRILKAVPSESDCLTMSFNIKDIKQNGYYPECGKFVFSKFDYLVTGVKSKYDKIVLYTAQELDSEQFLKYKSEKKVVIKSIKELTTYL